jgi:hypothetical protein
MVCELHSARDEEGAIIVVLQHGFRAASGAHYNCGGSEHAHVRIPLSGLRSDVYHPPEPRRARRCTRRVPTLSGEERCAGLIPICRSDLEKKLAS